MRCPTCANSGRPGWLRVCVRSQQGGFAVLWAGCPDCIGGVASCCDAAGSAQPAPGGFYPNEPEGLHRATAEWAIDLCRAAATRLMSCGAHNKSRGAEACAEIIRASLGVADPHLPSPILAPGAERSGGDGK